MEQPPSLHDNGSPWFCPSHYGEDIRGYCTICERHVCWQCVARRCAISGHVIVSMDEALQKVKGYLTNLQPYKLQQMQKKLLDVERLARENENGSTQAMLDIDESCLGLIDKINRRTGSLNVQLGMTTDQIREIINEEKDQVQYDRDKTNHSIREYRRKLSEIPENRILSFSAKVQNNLENIKNESACAELPEFPNVPNFYKSDFRSDVDKLLGKLALEDKENNFNSLVYTDKMELKREINASKKKTIMAVSPDDPKHVWVMCRHEHVLRMIDEDGFEIRRIHLHIQPSCISITTKNEALLAIPYERQICMLSLGSEGQIYPSSLISTGPTLIPFGLAAQSCYPSEAIWVSLIENYDFVPTLLSYRLVRCYTWDGNFIKEIEYDNKGRRLFTVPGKLAINDKTSDIATVNRLSEGSGEVVTTDSSGFLIAKFSKIPALLRPFSETIHPTDVAFNAVGHVMFSDMKSKTIVILDGTYKTVVSRYKLDGGIPVSLACHQRKESCIWTGRSDGKICAIRYVKGVE